MASICSRIAVLCTISTLLWAVCSAAHSAAAPAVDCSSLVLSMADCLTFVTEGSMVKKPEGTCCSGLKSVLKTDDDCLCEAFRNSAQLGMTINVSKAMTLPKACHLATPPSVSNCALTIGTGAAPAEAPVAASPSSVARAPPATGVIANVTPVSVHSGSSSSSGASSLLPPFVLLVVATAAASFPLF